MGFFDEAVRMFGAVNDWGICPNVMTVGSKMDCLCKKGKTNERMGRVGKAVALLEEMVKVGCEPNVHGRLRDNDHPKLQIILKEETEGQPVLTADKWSSADDYPFKGPNARGCRPGRPGRGTSRGNSGRSSSNVGRRGGRDRGQRVSRAADVTFVTATGEPLNGRCFVCGDW
ncbi:hypothetical protein QJS04_geneDACA013101 [Acorus gramineus]|uniref:Pentatricopeptide repeat-containing protein n=1 Tax=Acorus gramineus TaxID=55184 RepID=A0AAV9B590_ACOGR|nr:hypothetical protein QJS04_geneDACA013101 [Acorus gramineus]